MAITRGKRQPKQPQRRRRGQQQQQRPQPQQRRRQQQEDGGRPTKGAVSVARIHKAYRTPGHPTAFASPATVARYFRNRGVTEQKAKKALEETDSYVLHKEYKSPKIYNPYYIYSRRELVQGDLFDVSSIAKDNDGVKYILLLIDVFSRRVWTYPMKTKSMVECANKLRIWLASLRKKPAVLSVDGGKEFMNRDVKALLRREHVTLHRAEGTSKACYAERANKTMQLLIYKYLSDRETTRYIDVLHDLTASYNSRGHRSLQYMTPNDADSPRNAVRVLDMQRQRWNKITERAAKRKKHQFKIGDCVRIKKNARALTFSTRSYAPQFKGEYFTIERVNTSLPVPMYHLKSMDTKEHIKGGFYANELSRVRGDVFKSTPVPGVRMKGKGRNRLVRVHWKWFSKAHDSWIYARDVTDQFQN